MTKKPKDWVPLIALTRRIGGRLCRADNAHAITLTSQERSTCVDAITRRYLSRLTRVRAGLLWQAYGPRLAALAWKDPRHSPVDKQLDQLVAKWQESTISEQPKSQPTTRSRTRAGTAAKSRSRSGTGGAGRST